MSVRIGLGGAEYARQSGFLYLLADKPSPQLSTPDALYLALHKDVITYAPSGALQQLKPYKGLVEITVLDDYTYTLSFYHESDVASGPVDPYELVPGATPFSTITVENPDGASSYDRLRFTEDFEGSILMQEYQWDATAANWTLLSGTGSGQRRDVKTTVWTVPDTEWEETTEVRDSADDVVHEQTETFHVYPWGVERTQQIIDPDVGGRQLVTSWTYYDDEATDGDNYGKMETMTGPGGYWERYEYDSAGRLAKTVAQWLDAALGADESQSRVLLRSNGMHGAIPMLTQSESIKGQLVRKSFTLFHGGGAAEKVEEDIRCVDPNATPDSTSGVLRTHSRHGAPSNPILRNRPIRTVHPDGTISYYEYQVPDNSVRTKLWNGVPVGDPLTATTISDGAYSETTVNANGVIIEREIDDIPSNILLSHIQVTQQDDFSRPLVTTYLDGTTEQTSYDCCGMDTQTNREGTAITFLYDQFGRVTERSISGIAEVTEYDVMGRITNVVRRGTDASEITLRQSVFNIAGDLAETRDGVDNVTAINEAYMNGHRVVTTMHPDGGTQIGEYFSDGALYQISGSAVAPQRFEYDVAVLSRDNGVTPESLNTRTTKTIALEESGGSLVETDEWTIEYTDMLGRSVRTKYSDGSTVDRFYNEKGRLERTVDADGHITIFAYNDLGELVDTVVDMDQDGVIDYAGTDRVSRVTGSVLYDGARGGYVARRTTERWTVDNDGSNTVVSHQSDVTPDGLEQWDISFGQTTHRETEYPGSGLRRETVTAPDGSFTVSLYQDGRLVRTAHTNALDVQIGAVDYAYDAHGRVATSTDARNGVTIYTYDAGDRVETITTPAPGPGQSPQVTTNTYDSMGRVTNVMTAAGTVDSEYDLQGNLTNTHGSLTYPVGYTYDTQGRLKTMTTWQDYSGDTGKATTTWEYDSERDFLESKEYHDGKGPSYTYTDAGRLKTRTWARLDASSNALVTTYGYDAAGGLVSVNYSDASMTDIVHRNNRVGLATQVTDSVGTRTLVYAADGQLESETLTIGSVEIVLDPDYDSLDRRDTLDLSKDSSSVWNTEFDYDPASRLKTVTHGDHAATYTYETNSALIASVSVANQYNDELVSARSHDFLNRLVGIGITFDAGGGADTVNSFTYGYNALNQRTNVALHSGEYWDYLYDGLGQVTSGVKRLSSGEGFSGYDFGYQFDDIGNRKGASANGQTSTYTLSGDMLNQYASRTVPGAVDLLGRAETNAIVTVDNHPVTRQQGFWHAQRSVENSTGDVYRAFTVVGVVNNVNTNGEDAVAEATRSAFVPSNVVEFAYDDDGNLTRDGQWIYTWNGENRLIELETRADLASSVPRRKLEFTYDHQGRRVRKVVTDLDSSSVLSDLYFIYDGWNLLAELDNLNSLSAERTHVWGLDLSGTEQGAGGVEGLLMTKPSSTAAVHYAAYDGNGNVMALVKSGNGTLGAVYEYDPFGNILRATGPVAEANPVRFSTKYTDGDSGMVYYGYRNYAPGIGRWLSRDPIGERAGLSLYCLVANNSVNAVDLLGLTTLTVTISCEGHEELLANVTYLSEEEPPGPDGREGAKVYRRLPSPGNSVAADAIYFPDGTAWKIPNTTRAWLACRCLDRRWQLIYLYSDLWIPFTDRDESAEWRRSDPAPPPRWPGGDIGSPPYRFPPYQGEPPVPSQPPLDPVQLTEAWR